MFDRLVYKYFDRTIYKLFYWRWNPKLRESKMLRQNFLDKFRIWEENEVGQSKLAMDYAIMWARTSSAKTNENLAKLFDKAMWEIRNADPRKL